MARSFLCLAAEAAALSPCQQRLVLRGVAGSARRYGQEVRYCSHDVVIEPQTDTQFLDFLRITMAVELCCPALFFLDSLAWFVYK